MLAIAHTVVVDESADDDQVYQAESPDELALVQGASSLGYLFR